MKKFRIRNPCSSFVLSNFLEGISKYNIFSVFIPRDNGLSVYLIHFSRRLFKKISSVLSCNNNISLILVKCHDNLHAVPDLDVEMP